MEIPIIYMETMMMEVTLTTVYMIASVLMAALFVGLILSDLREISKRNKEEDNPLGSDNPRPSPKKCCGKNCHK